MGGSSRSLRAGRFLQMAVEYSTVGSVECAARMLICSQVRDRGLQSQKLLQVVAPCTTFCLVPSDLVCCETGLNSLDPFLMGATTLPFWYDIFVVHADTNSAVYRLCAIISFIIPVKSYPYIVVRMHADLHSVT